jgi:hypothetical protein
VSNYSYLDEADKAVAHRQCARNADALKSDEGEFEPPHPAMRNDMLIFELKKLKPGTAQTALLTILFLRPLHRRSKSTSIQLREEYHETEWQGISCLHNVVLSNRTPTLSSIS